MLTAQPVNSRDLGPRRGNLAIDWMIDRRAEAVRPGFFLWLLFFHMCTYTCMFFFPPSPLTQSFITFKATVLEQEIAHRDLTTTRCCIPLAAAAVLFNNYLYIQ